MKTQEQMYWDAFNKTAEINKLFLDMVSKNDITKEELQKLIEKRPNVYGHLKGWLNKLPSKTTKEL